MPKDYFFLAIGNLRHRGLRSWLTMLGIFIGIAAVVSLISLGSGLQEAITGQFTSLDTDKLFVQNVGTGFGPPGSTVVRKLTEHDVEIIEQVGGIDEVISRIIRVVSGGLVKFGASKLIPNMVNDRIKAISVEYNKEKSFNFIASIPENDDKIEVINDALNVDVESGKLLTKEDKGKVVVGSNFKEDVFDKEVRIGTKLKLQGESFEVIGVLKKGSTFQINSVILMLEDDLRDLLDVQDEIDIIIIQVEDEGQIIEVGKKIERKLRKDRKLKLGEEDFSVQTPVQSVQGINNILNIINLVVAGIAGLSLIVGGVGIANTMYTSILERTKDIGIMKSVGAKNKDILMIFLFESALLGLVGGIIGAAMGLGLAFLISEAVGSFLGGIDLAVEISLPLLIAAVSFSLLIGMVSGIIPAYQASKLNPVEALRK